MKVAVLYATDFGPVSPGGIQEFILRVGLHAPIDAEITYFGVGSPQRLPRDSDRFVPLLRNLSSRKVNAQYFQALVRMRNDLEEFDVILVHRAEHVIAIPRRRPSVLVLHGGTWNALRAGNWLLGPAYPLIEVESVRRAGAVISVAPQSHWWGTQLAMRQGPRRLRAPVDEIFRWSATPPSRWDRLITASRLVPEKRVHKLVRLASRLDVQLVVFGDGPERPRLESEASALRARVTFRGSVTAPVIAKEYERGGIFCLSSRFEGFPLAAAEAAVAGLPVLGVASRGVDQLSDVGALRARTVMHAARLVADRRLAPIDRERAWSSLGAESVAHDFWTTVKGVVS